MADVMPNYKLEQQRKRSQIAEQRAVIERQRLDILEMEDRKIRHETNIEAAEKAIEKYTAELKGLEEIHGRID